jgi:hypothetical protein
MRSFFFSAVFLCLALTTIAQSDTTSPVKIFRPMQARSKDHFMLQLGGALWQNKPDSIKTGGGLSRTFNMYLMLDFPFKTSPKFSVALGPGLSTDHVFLDKMTAGIAGTGTNIVFRNVKDTNSFEKYKVSTAFLELPIELRFSSNPDADGKSFKAAVGLRAGTMLAAWVKGKGLQNRAGNTINDYILKEKSKRYFNTTRISAIGRLGFGHFTAFASYALTSVFKEGVGPKMNAMSIGLTISGL